MASNRPYTIDELDRIARETNLRIRQELEEVFGKKENYPTVSQAAVRIVLSVAANLLDAQPAPPQGELPAPDWASAPREANWWTIDNNGNICWWVSEPDRGNDFEWYVYGEDALDDSQYIDIPLGIDWRTLKQPRPALDAGGG